MNGKTSKKLRSAAERLSVGQPDRAYSQSRKDGSWKLENCTRAIYKELKREYKRIRRS